MCFLLGWLEENRWEGGRYRSGASVVRAAGKGPGQEVVGLQGRGSGRRPKLALDKLWFLRPKTELESGKEVLFRIPPHGLHL